MAIRSGCSPAQGSDARPGVTAKPFLNGKANYGWAFFDGIDPQRKSWPQRAAHTIVISRLSWGAKMVLGISAWTPRTMSTTCVTRKLTATLHSA